MGGVGLHGDGVVFVVGLHAVVAVLGGFVGGDGLSVADLVDAVGIELGGGVDGGVDEVADVAIGADVFCFGLGPDVHVAGGSGEGYVEAVEFVDAVLVVFGGVSLAEVAFFHGTGAVDGHGAKGAELVLVVLGVTPE